MFHKVIFAILLNLLICTTSVVLSNSCVASDYQITPIPQWVDKVVVDPSNHLPDTNDGGIDYLLLDMQTKVEPSSITYFERKIKKVLKSKSLQDIANLEIAFNPQYETVAFHHVSINRGEKTVNQIVSKNIKVLQREKRLESLVYTGEKSLLILLEDVRVGDVLEYSYSIENRDPRRLKDFYQGLYITESQPIAQMSYRLLWPKDRPLTINNHNTNKAPTIKNEGNQKEYIWEFKNVNDVELEQDTPSWHTPWEWIEIAAKRSWNDVATTQSQNYKIAENISKELKQFISGIQKEYKNPNDQLIAAIRFVQDEIRYMSVSDQTYLPADPSVVFQRRYGDCRDKSLLALTILKGLGIKASAALVDTNDGKTLHELSPRYTAFNHVIVLVYLGEKQYWFDPTATYERGNLENLTQPDYGYALVLDPNTTALIQFPTPLPTASSHMIYETIDLTHGFEAPALFNVKTVYKGKYANLHREWLITQGKEKLKNEYLNYYKESYSPITPRDGFEITDDHQKNEITIVENYKIKKPGKSNWGEGDGDSSLNFFYYVKELQSYYKDNISLPRTMPLSVVHPILFIKHIEIYLPERDWDLQPERVIVNDAAFNFMKTTQFNNNKYSIFYQYVSHDDHVKAEKASEYRDNADKLKSEWNGGINSGLESTDSINWPVLVLSLLVSIIFIVACFKIYFYKLKKKLYVPTHPQYQGIRGWLILPAIGLILTPFIDMKDVVEYFSIVHSLNTWDLLSDTSGVDYHPLKAPYLLSTLFFMLAEVIFSGLLLFLFFKKKRIFPIIFIAFMWVDLTLFVCLGVANYAFLKEPLSELHPTIGMLLGSIIWTAYFLRSKRVKATFIRE